MKDIGTFSTQYKELEVTVYFSTFLLLDLINLFNRIWTIIFNPLEAGCQIYKRGGILNIDMSHDMCLLPTNW